MVKLTQNMYLCTYEELVL